MGAWMVVATLPSGGGLSEIEPPEVAELSNKERNLGQGNHVSTSCRVLSLYLS